MPLSVITGHNEFSITNDDPFFSHKASLEHDESRTDHKKLHKKKHRTATHSPKPLDDGVSLPDMVEMYVNG